MKKKNRSCGSVASVGLADFVWILYMYKSDGTFPQSNVALWERRCRFKENLKVNQAISLSVQTNQCFFFCYYYQLSFEATIQGFPLVRRATRPDMLLSAVLSSLLLNIFQIFKFFFRC